MDSVRVDKWLWAARMYKTRSQATEACDGGHVKIDGETVKPSKPVKPGVKVEALTPGGKKVLEVVGLADVRGPAPAAQALYVDHTPPPEPRDPWLDGPAPRLATSKKDRRAQRRFTGRGSW